MRESGLTLNGDEYDVDKRLLITIATEYRQEHSKPSGVVLIFEEKVYGWKNELRDANHERPGVFAVDADNNIFRAEGGNDYDGAKHWVVV